MNPSSGNATCREAFESRVRRHLAVGLLLLSAIALPAAEPPRLEFRVPAGRAERTLNVFSRQAHIELLFAVDIVRGVRTRAVRGSFTPREALTLMLARTSLAVLIDEQTGAFAIARTTGALPALARSPAAAKTTDPKAEAQSDRPEDPDDEPVVLSPFEVRTSADVGYVATATLAGSRLTTPLRDVATKVSVMTPEFLQDLAITNLDDAMLYSLNTEPRFETGDVSAPGGFGIADTTVPGLGSTRTRNLGPPNTGHDFFDTALPIDSYNTERFTFSSGPNSILFGNSQPSGAIDTTFKRALPDRSRGELTYRIDNHGSHRATGDFNQPLIPERLALRIATLSDRKHDWRAPAFGDQDRFFASLLFRPVRKLGLRAWYESSALFANPARNTLVQDHVTPWRNAGSPEFDNGGGLAAPFPVVTSPFAVRDPNIPIYVFGAEGALAPVGSGGNTVTTQGFDATTPSPDNFEHSIVDSGLYPHDRNFSGNANQSKTHAWIRGAMLEVNPRPGLFVEAGLNEERFRHKGADFFDTQVAELSVDANRYLDDRLTPNANFGRYFFENKSPHTSRNYFQRKQTRLSLSYELDFEQRSDWMRWLGRHRLALLLDRREAIQISETSDFRVVGDYTFTNANADSRNIAFRYYLDPQQQVVQLPFDPLADGLVTIPGGVDAAGRPVTIAAWDPSTPPTSLSTTRTLVASRTLRLQSHLLRNHLVMTLGLRRDDVEIQQAPDATPRWDFGSLTTDRLPWVTQKRDSPVTRLKSVVVHPAHWLSLAYAESNSERVDGSNRRDLDGTLAVNGAGYGREYSATLEFSGRLSLQLTHYHDVSIGNLSALRAASPTPTIGARGNNLRREVANLERSAQIYESLDAGDPTGGAFVRSPTYAYYQNAIAQALPAGQTATAAVLNTFDLLSDRQSRGWEISLIGNPTPAWRLMLSATRSATAEDNVGPQYFDFIRERLPVWARYAERPFLPNTQGVTVGQVLDVAVLNFNYTRLSQGRMNTLERRYRCTLTGRYTVGNGPLRGSFIGATALWRSSAAVGYLKKVITDNPFVVPGRVASSLQLDDLDQPVRGGSVTSFDLFLGHERKLDGGRVLWRVQLNVRNLFDRNGLLTQRALSDGDGAIYTVQEPRTLILTNTFRF